MSKLPKQYRFVDLSDYGRGSARLISNTLQNTSVTPIHVTSWFIVAGLAAIVCMMCNYYISAAFFLILKSVLDAADGELSRIKNTPSYTGRYYDSIADIILNLLFLITISYLTSGTYLFLFLAFIGIQLQGTLYNYYYVILRNNVAGDTTSRIFEDHIPNALHGESQQTVNILYKIYNALYIVFDKTIYLLDKGAVNSKPFPKWFMTLLSTFGLGFHLLIMAIFLVFGWIELIIPFFVYSSIFILVFIAIRKVFLK